MSENPKPKPSPFAARTNAPFPVAAAAAVPPPAPVAAAPGKGSGGTWVWFAAVAGALVIAFGLWLLVGGKKPVAPVPVEVEAQAPAPVTPPPPVLVAPRAPRDERADYAELARIAASGGADPAERSILATAALRAADGAFGQAVEGVGPVAWRVIEAEFAKKSAVLAGVELADHDEPGVRTLRVKSDEAAAAAKDKRWAEAVSARVSALEALPQALEEIAGRLNVAARDAATRGDESMAIYFYQKVLRLSPARTDAKAYLFEKRYAPGQRVRTAGGIELAYVPPGVFTRGSRFIEPGRDTDEAPAEVRLPFGVFFSVTEVTQRQWDQVYGPGAAARTIAAAPAGSKAVGPELPMHSVRWDEAVDFCRRLSEKDGATYRLPTEAEWEYACRAGTITAFNTGADYLGLSDAVIDDGSNSAPEAPAPVGTAGRPNAWNLQDMHGNVWEWCADWSAPYPQGAATAPTGPDDAAMGRADLAMRTVRGGGWNTSARDARSANRWEYPPVAATGYIGFRFVSEPDLTAP